jgi:hypothetical protein
MTLDSRASTLDNLQNMRFFAIADPHLSKAQAKPMSIFGDNWEGHPEVFFEGWREVVGPEDVVLIPGDISWAMGLEEALLDLQDIAELPGSKIILRGNHDYWWASISKVRKALPSGIYALQNDSLVLGEVAIAGTRGWDTPQSRPLDKEDRKIYLREVERLKLSLESLKTTPYQKLIVALHFPPTLGEANGFTDLLEEYRPDGVVYGHLHGANPERLIPQWQGIPLHLVAADFLNFRPKLILDLKTKH